MSTEVGTSKVQIITLQLQTSEIEPLGFSENTIAKAANKVFNEYKKILFNTTKCKSV